MVEVAQPCLTSLVCSCEAARLKALREMRILDKEPEENFDRIARLAKHVMNTPIVTIALIDHDRQWFRSSIGVSMRKTSREVSFCAQTIKRLTPLIVRDALLDPGFRNSPLVLGEPHVRFYMGVPLRTVEGLSVGTLCIMDCVPRTPLPDHLAVMQDLAGLLVNELELRRAADTDGLTRIMTRRALLRDGRKVLAQASRDQKPLSCLVIDVDHFKSVNDSLGHAAGDLALQSIASVCRASLRSIDLLGRIGGEEFAVVLPDASVEDAAGIAERLRQEIEATPVLTQAGPVWLTVSVGVSSRNERHTALDPLLDEADTALYEAKGSGRNRVVVAGVSRALLLQTGRGSSAA